MYVAFIVANGDCYVSHFVYVKMKVILMIIGGDPANPDATGLLTRKHSHRIVVLVKEDKWGFLHFLNRSIHLALSLYVCLSLCRWSYCGRVENDVDVIPVIWHHILH